MARTKLIRLMELTISQVCHRCYSALPMSLKKAHLGHSRLLCGPCYWDKKSELKSSAKRAQSND